MHASSWGYMFLDALRHSARVGVENERGTESFAFLGMHTPTPHTSTFVEKGDFPVHYSNRDGSSPQECGMLLINIAINFATKF